MFSNPLHKPTLMEVTHIDFSVLNDDQLGLVPLTQGAGSLHTSGYDPRNLLIRSQIP